MVQLTLGGREYRIGRARGEVQGPTLVDPRLLIRAAIYAGHRVGLTALVYPATPAPPWLTDQQLAARVIDAIRRSELVVELVARAPIGAPAVAEGEAVAPATSDPVITTRDERETWFELRLLDEIGSPIEGITVAMQPGGPTPTDGAGAARVTVPATPQGGGEVQSLDDLRAMVSPRWQVVRPEPWIEDAPRQSFIPLVGSPSTSVALPAERPYTLVIQPWVVRAHLDGLVFDTNKSFLLPDAVHRAGGDAPIDRLREWLDDHPDTTALVVGHTDPSGDPSYNDPLSLERAESFVAFLTGDVDHWTAYYEHPAWEKRWGIHEDRSMLQALAERWDFPTVGRVQAFQSWAGIDVDGFIGPQTRGALVTAYMDLQDTTKALPDDLTAHGCGESFPKMDKPDRPGVEGAVVDPDMEDQRRVEVFLFPADTGVQPPPPGTVSPASGEEYPEWVRRARRSRDLRADAGLAAMTVWTMRKHDASELVPETRVTVTGPDDETTTFFRVADHNGLAHFEGLEPGRYHILAQKAGFEDETRFVQLRRSGVTDDDDDVVLMAADGDVATPDVDESQRVDVPMDGPLEITRLVGETPSWDPDSATHRRRLTAHERDSDIVELKPDRLVVFRQGERVTVRWTVEAPHRPEVKLHGGGDTPVHTLDVPENPTSGNRWSGTVELDLQARLEDGTDNSDYAPPEDDGHYRLVAREGGKEAEEKLPVAGVAFFGAVAAGDATLSTCSQQRWRRPDGTMTDVPVLHAEHGNMLEGDFRMWRKEPHGYSAPQADVQLEWVVVGTQHVGMQLEVLTAEPESIQKPGTTPAKNFDYGWHIDWMSKVQGPLTPTGSMTVKNDQVTLRATIHLFRNGSRAQDWIHEAHWGTKNRLGGSVLLVAEDRPMEKLDAKDLKLWMSPIHPHPDGGGFYRAVREGSIDAPVLGDHQRGADVTLEIITRAAKIWKLSYPDRPFGLGDIYGPFPAHKTHYQGRAFDIMALRSDGKVEVAASGKTNDVTVIDGATKTQSTRTHGRPTKTAAVTPPFDPPGMTHLIMLFVDVMDAVAEPNNQERFLQVVFDDERITDAVKAARSHVEVGTEVQIMKGKPQQTHLWHTHFLIRLPSLTG